MNQIKLFKGIENEIQLLEEEMNQWIRANNATVIQMFGNISPQTLARDSTGLVSGDRRYAPSDLFVAVLYTTGS